MLEHSYGWTGRSMYERQPVIRRVKRLKEVPIKMNENVKRMLGVSLRHSRRLCRAYDA